MIRSLVNLRCSAGHRFYAPPREYLEWIGRDCLYGGAMRTNGQTTLGRCLHALAPTDLSALTPQRQRCGYAAVTKG